MNEGSEAIGDWLEQKRRTDRSWAAAISLLALGGGTVVFLLMSLVVYTILSLVCGAFVNSMPLLALAALGLTGGFFVYSVKGRQPQELELGLDPMGFWIVKDICSIGPRLILEGLRQVRRCGELGELNVAACARVLAYLARQNAAVAWEDLLRHCAQLPPNLREQLFLIDGVLFVGEDAARVSLMDPFRLLLRSLLGREPSAGEQEEPARPRPEPAPQAVPVTEPEKLSAFEILGLSPSASMVEIKLAYRKRVKACHPDLFAGMDEQAKDLAERWTKALNAAYGTLKGRRTE